MQSLDRGLAVIRCFSEAAPRRTISDVARETGLTRAAARRFLHTLENLGYVGKDGSLFFLRPRVLELGYAFLSSLTLPDIAHSHLMRLAESLHESCSASVLDEGDVVYVARAQANRIMTIALTVGSRLPAYATSMGRVLLAGLDDDALSRYLRTLQPVAMTAHTITDPAALRVAVETARRAGYAVIDQELELGVRSVAVPVRTADGVVAAALNVSAHATRTSMEQLERDFLPMLLSTASAVEQDLAARR